MWSKRSSPNIPCQIANRKDSLPLADKDRHPKQQICALHYFATFQPKLKKFVVYFCCCATQGPCVASKVFDQKKQMMCSAGIVRIGAYKPFINTSGSPNDCLPE